MTEEQIALGRRAVACKGWRWMDGMKANNDPEYGSVVSSCWSSSTSIRMPDWRMDDVMSGRWLPDLADPATLGCLLALVREAWDIPLHLDDTGGRMVTIQSGPGGSTLVIDKIDAEKDRKVINGWRDVSVFVAALEAAP